MFDFFGRRDLLSAASLICIAYVVALAASSSSAANIAYRDPSNPALPKAGAVLDLPRTTAVVRHPQIHSMSPRVAAWSEIGGAATEHRLDRP